MLSASDMPHAPPGDAKGVRITFTAADGSHIPSNAGGGFELGLKQRPGVEDLTENTTVKNTVESEVALGEQTKTDENTADYTIISEDISVKAEKSFTPNELIPGQETTVALKGTNTSLIDLDWLKIREPATGTFAKELAFGGFTSEVQFPFDAASGTLTLNYLDTDGAPKTLGPIALTDGAAFPDLPGDFGSLQFFELDFTGPIEPGSSSEVACTAEATDAVIDPETGSPVAPVKNVVGVTGSTATAEATDPADDTVTFSKKQLEIVTEKKLTPAEI